MTVNFLSLENLIAILNNIKEHNVNNIEIKYHDFAVIPYLDFFIDCCKELGCNVKIKKQLLVNLDIFEHFCDRV